MRLLNDISREKDAMAVVTALTSAFEGIASMHISQIKDKVLRSQKFFDELWRIYRQIRVDTSFHFGRHTKQIIPKQLMILITAEGSFSGDIDERLIDKALAGYSPQKNDILVIGSHGAVQLSQRDVPFIASFKLPDLDEGVDVEPIIAHVQKYASTTCFYPAYVSLMSQSIKSIELSVEVAERGKNVTTGDEIISERDYIFEPSTHEVVDHLERSMTQIMIGEVILEAKLAQYASRFRAMSAAHDKATSTFRDLTKSYNRARRLQKDERLKEILNGLRKVYP
ncbi:MAG: FoF1 ATP synthase subunit gamma [Candidatus Saccharimonadales bacterium]